MTSRRSQRENRPDPLDVAALERELHSKQPRSNRRAAERTAARAEAESITKASSPHLRSRPVGTAS